MTTFKKTIMTNSSFCALFVILLIAFSGVGCRHGRPARKTLPDGVGLEDGEPPESKEQSSDNLPFFLSDTVVNSMGFRRQLFLVSLPDPRYDSIAWNIVHAFEPLEGTVIDLFHEQRKAGAVIDLREGQEGGFQSSEFVASYGSPKPEKFTLIFIWDRLSDSRAAAYMQFATQIRGIICTTPNKRTGSSCFENTPTIF
jgi:hypothetical protein